MQLSLSAARQQIGDCLGRADADTALELIERLRERFPRDYRLCLLAGRALLAKGELDQARAELECAAAAAPDDRDIQVGLGSCGVEDAQLLVADLPPLVASNGERPRISATALGHLYLRQFLLTHCTAQLEPIWQTRRDRPDVGLALAEAHWRLLEAAAAEEICRTLLESQPDCLKANLILAQMLSVSGQQAAAADLISKAQDLDPENEVAEDLYEWLTARDPSLVPLRHRELLVDLPESVVVETVPRATTEPATEPERQQPAEPEERVEEPAPEPVLEERVDEPAPEPALEERVGEPLTMPEALVEEQLPAPVEVVLAQPPTEPPAEVPEPFWERQEEPSPVTVLPEPATIPEITSEPDIAETAPEPALAALEREAQNRDQPEGVSVEWLEVDHHGQIGPRTSMSVALAGSQNARVTAWTLSCRGFSTRFSLGALKASSIDSDRGALQVLHQADHAVVALAPLGANLGLVRARLRQSLDSSKEHIPS